MKPKEVVEFAKKNEVKFVDLKFIDFPGVALVILGQVQVLVPFKTMTGLDEANTPLGKTAGQKTLAAEVIRDAGTNPVQIERGLRFFGNVRQMRRFGLHPESQFVRLDHPLNLRVGLSPFQLLMIHGLN